MNLNNNSQRETCAVLITSNSRQGLEESVVVCGTLKEMDRGAEIRHSGGASISLPKNWKKRVLSTPRDKQDMFCGCSKYIVVKKSQISPELDLGEWTKCSNAIKTTAM